MDEKDINKKVEKAMKDIDMEKLEQTIQKAVEGIEEKVMKAVEGLDGIGNVEIEREEEYQEGVMKNLGVMNMKDATEEEIDNIKKIKNLGVLIVPEKYLGKITSKVRSNLGIIVPYTEGMRLYSGNTEIDESMLEALDEPIEILQTGQLTFKEGVSAESIKQKIAAIKNYGHIVAPESVYGVVLAKVIENSGQISKNGED